MMNLHDIPGTHRTWVQLGAYAAATDHGFVDVVFRAPFDCNLHTITAYFGAEVVGEGTAGDYFTYVVKGGTVAIGTAGPDTTIASRTAFEVFAGTRSLSENDLINLTYGTAAGTAGINAPRALLELQFKAR